MKAAREQPHPTPAMVQNPSREAVFARRIEEYLEVVRQEAPSALKMFQRCFAGKVSPRVAIKCKCMECICHDRAAIRDCTSPTCPLHPYRPFQKDAES
mgnify:FL=1